VPQAKSEELQKQLDFAHQKTERAEAMAERTKSGFVYIISNVGSFGADVRQLWRYFIQLTINHFCMFSGL
jgi:hypothetical protein